jgi:serine phosphatase RsbU (regulator of sigma subunit)/integral membrane sensor domain MASE1
VQANSRSTSGQQPAGDGSDRRWGWTESPGGEAKVFLVVLVAYALGSAFALYLIELSGLSSVFFIPAGVTLAFLLRTSRRLWPWILVAAAMAEASMDLVAGYSPGATLGYVIANTIEPLVGATLVLRFCGRPDLARVRDVWWTLLLAVFVAPAIGGALGALPASLLGESDFLVQSSQWWIGDALGVLLIGFGILVWDSSPDRRSMATSWGLILLAGTTLLTLTIFAVSPIPLLFLVLVGVTVAGAQFGTRAVATTASIVAVLIALRLAGDPESLVPNLEASTALLVVKLQLGVFTMAGFVVAAEAFEAARAGGEAERARARAQVFESERRMERHIATRLQRAFLPEDPEQHPNLGAAARYLAGSDDLEIGGDWYDIVDLSERHVGVIVGDVAGHGLEAAVSMGKLRTAALALAMQGLRPNDLLHQLDHYASKRNVTDFATLSYAILDTVSGKLLYASAGHPPILAVSPDGSSEWLMEGRRPPLLGEMSPLGAEATTTLEHGSLIVAFTDGLVERRGEDLLTGLRRLQETVSASGSADPERLCEILLEEMGVIKDRADDVVVLVLRYQPPP